MSQKSNIEKLINDKGMQMRDFRGIKLETRKNEQGEDELVLEGVPATFDQETVLFRGAGYEYREVISPQAFDNCDMTDVIFNYNHCGRVYARTRNNTLALEIKEDGLHMSAKLRSDDNGHKELYNDIQTGTIDKMSFAFTVDSDSVEYKEEDGLEVYTRTVLSINKLFDVSAVDIPAYDSTEISARSAFDSVREERLKAIETKAEELRIAKARYEYSKEM